MKILCISGKAQHGKDTFAQFMLEQIENHSKSVLIFHYADLLKFICQKYFKWNGIKDDEGREILQQIGTNVIRARDPDYWVDYAIRFFNVFKDKWDYVLIPDARFPNEIDRMREAGFDVMHIRVYRPFFDNGLTEEQQNHPSETALDDYPVDRQVFNVGDLEYLKGLTEKIFTTYLSS